MNAEAAERVTDRPLSIVTQLPVFCFTTVLISFLNEVSMVSFKSFSTPLIFILYLMVPFGVDEWPAPLSRESRPGNVDRQTRRDTQRLRFQEVLRAQLKCMNTERWKHNVWQFVVIAVFTDWLVYSSWRKRRWHNSLLKGSDWVISRIQSGYPPQLVASPPNMVSSGSQKTKTATDVMPNSRLRPLQQTNVWCHSGFALHSPYSTSEGIQEVFFLWALNVLQEVLSFTEEVAAPNLEIGSAHSSY